MMNVEIEGLDQAMRRLEQIASPVKRKYLLAKVGRRILKNSRQRTRSQTDLEGRSFVPHAAGRKRKMLTRLSRAKNMNIVRVDENSMVVGFRNPVHERIAAKQQLGFSERMTAAKMSSRQSNAHANATRRQAKALRDEGYKIKRSNGNGYRTPSLKWITENMNQGRAGIILRALRGGSKREWETELPARSFLGINEQDNTELNTLIMHELDHALES